MLKTILASFIRRISRNFGFKYFMLPSLSDLTPDESELLSVIERHLPNGSLEDSYYVDIGASDGTSWSNTYTLLLKGWSGLAVECDTEKFANLAARYLDFDHVQLAKCKVTPDNIVSLLIANSVPRDFAFLSLDIDGYDYFVLEQLLSSYRPRLICAEINEKIPPPIKFTVKYDPAHVWSENHFYGQSLAQLNYLAEKHEYSLVDLHYCNALLVPSELCSKALSPEEAYRSGYQHKVDRREKFPWNADMEDVLQMKPDKAMQFLIKYFEEYENRFEISL